MHAKAPDFYTPISHNYIFYITIYVVVCCVSIKVTWKKKKVTWSGSLQFVLFTFFWASWIWMLIYFPRLVKFLSITSLNKPSASFSLFSFWDTYNAHICPFVVSHKSLRYLYSFYPFFFFWLNESHWPAFKFADPFFCLVWSAIVLFYWDFCCCCFQFSYCILIFSLCWNPLFLHCCLALSEHLYNYYFEVSIG